MTTFQEVLRAHGHANRFHAFQNLMRQRVKQVLLVCSLYDSFILEEDGQLYEKLYSEHHNLSLITVPGLQRVSTGREALQLASVPGEFDLIITTLHLGDMHALEFAEQVRAADLGIPVVLLTYDERGLNELASRSDMSAFEKVFLWQGDFRILIAIIKHIEDRMNVEHDTRAVGVQSVILIEDNVHFYSSYLPMIYEQLFAHSLSLLSEGSNAAQRFLRMRARPKILLCTTYEEAWHYYVTYARCILGVISDIKFPHQGIVDPEAGLLFTRHVKQSNPDVPILLQSNSPELQSRAEGLGASFLLKSSPILLQELQRFMKEQFSFGDFVFRRPDGSVEDRAKDMRELEQKVQEISEESLRYHAERNHFSSWLKARTEFWLAHRWRASQVSHFDTIEDVRRYMVTSLRQYRRERSRGLVVDFDAADHQDFARVGGGSLGGKARGLGFVAWLLQRFNLRDVFPGVRIHVPEAVVLGTDIFDRFLDTNNLREFALQCPDDDELLARFLAGRFPEDVLAQLSAFIDGVRHPLAIRSSSLLEDSRYLPFAGVYHTHMLANNHQSERVRHQQFVDAVKRIYASTFSSHAKAYVRSTPYRLEEEKMAVIVQKLVGTAHGDRFYPDFSGVLRSHNYYPRPPMTTTDGIATVALGLGETVMEGHQSLRFCPRYPRHSTQFASTSDTLKNSQRHFYALKLPPADSGEPADVKLDRFNLLTAEKDGVLANLASTYSHENNAIYDGVAREGPRVVTFAPILKNDLFPLAGILEMMAEMGRWAMASPVEIEFAVNLSARPREFAFLQMRPMVAAHELEELNIADLSHDGLICRSERVLGNALISDVRDIVMTDPGVFDRSKSREAAQEFALYNAELLKEGRPYIAIGVGRWGSADPWLGIPVTWDQIAGARVIVEAGLKDLTVEPSQGTHFFQNLTSFGVGYFTVGELTADEFVDWGWLAAQEPKSRRNFVRHLRFDNAVIVKMNGHDNQGGICKPV